MALFGKKKKADAAETVVPDDPFAAQAPVPQPETPAAPAAPKEPAAPKIKVRPDVYTLMLGLSALALVIACILLYSGVAKYGSGPVSGIPRAMISLFGGLVF